VRTAVGGGFVFGADPRAERRGQRSDARSPNRTTIVSSARYRHTCASRARFAERVRSCGNNAQRPATVEFNNARVYRFVVLCTRMYIYIYILMLCRGGPVRTVDRALIVLGGTDVRRRERRSNRTISPSETRCSFVPRVCRARRRARHALRAATRPTRASSSRGFCRTDDSSARPRSRQRILSGADRSGRGATADGRPDVRRLPPRHFRLRVLGAHGVHANSRDGRIVIFGLTFRSTGTTTCARATPCGLLGDVEFTRRFVCDIARRPFRAHFDSRTWRFCSRPKTRRHNDGRTWNVRRWRYMNFPKSESNVDCAFLFFLCRRTITSRPGRTTRIARNVFRSRRTRLRSATFMTSGRRRLREIIDFPSCRRCSVPSVSVSSPEFSR